MKGIGLTKHGKSGKVHNSSHFTGKKSGKRIRRKGKKRNKKHRRIKYDRQDKIYS